MTWMVAIARILEVPPALGCMVYWGPAQRHTLSLQPCLNPTSCYLVYMADSSHPIMLSLHGWPKNPDP